MSSNVWTPATAQELSRMMETNFQKSQESLIPVGGRTAMRFGSFSSNAPQGSSQPAGEPVLVQTESLNRVLDYPARDMTITVEAGIRVDELQKLLKEENQQLPVDVAQSHRATIGGAIASNTSGPGRFGYGTFRDYVIGISAVDGQGRLFSAGGRVVKNVAGYDLCKLMIGSLGTLAIVTQVTLKLIPQPKVRELIVFPGEELQHLEEVLSRLNLSETRPVLIELLNQKAAWQLKGEVRQELPQVPFLLCLGYAGSSAEVLWQKEKVTEELKEFRLGSPQLISGEQADNLWKGLTEYQAASDDPLTFQANVPPSRVIEFIALASESDTALQAHAGNGVIIGHLADKCSGPESANEILRPLRKFAEEAGGSLVILNSDEEWQSQIDIFGSPRQSEALMRQVKQTFDPANLLNPGRLW